VGNNVEKEGVSFVISFGSRAYQKEIGARVLREIEAPSEPQTAMSDATSGSTAKQRW